MLFFLCVLDFTRPKLKRPSLGISFCLQTLRMNFVRDSSFAVIAAAASKLKILVSLACVRILVFLYVRLSVRVYVCV